MSWDYGITRRFAVYLFQYLEDTDSIGLSYELESSANLFLSLVPKTKQLSKPNINSTPSQTKLRVRR